MFKNFGNLNNLQSEQAVKTEYPTVHCCCYCSIAIAVDPRIRPWPQIKYVCVISVIAVATTEADEGIASSVFVQIKGIPPKKAAGRGHFDNFWSLCLV